MHDELRCQWCLEHKRHKGLEGNRRFLLVPVYDQVCRADGIIVICHSFCTILSVTAVNHIISYGPS